MKKPAKQLFSEKYVHIKNQLSKVIIGEKEINRFLDKLLNVLKVFIFSIRKFADDDCLTKAASIAYTTIISLIPALTVALTIYSSFKGVAGQKEEFFLIISNFMQEHDLQLNIDPILVAISQLIDNAGRIGGIGAAVMVFSATAMLRSLEKALNDIYRVRRHRNIFMKIIYYWAVLTLGPIMLIAATAVATQLTETLSAANYNSAQIYREKIWVVGDQGTLAKSPLQNMNFSELSKAKIDFDNQRYFIFERDEDRFVRNTYKRIYPEQLMQKNLIGIQFIGNYGWVISDDGLILISSDGGGSWSILLKENVRFRSIFMMNALKGYIVGEGSLLIRTKDGGNTWETILSGDHTVDFRNITFTDNIGLISASQATLLISSDSGEKWETIQIEKAIKDKKKLNINKAKILENGEIILIGDEGLVLKTSDMGQTWKYIGFKQYNYNSIYFFDNNRGLLGGNGGIIISTRNGGITWHRQTLPTQRINEVLFSQGKLWVFGNEAMVMVSDDMGESWDGIRGKNIFAFFINFSAPFVFIWFLFLMSYMSLPNTKVPFKEAAIGAAFTSTVWVIFILLFISYIRAFARGTFAIYGALVAIPLFLLMVYSSAVIILFGAEVSYTLMHPGLYKTMKRSPSEEKEDFNIINGLMILMIVYANFEKGLGGTTIKEIYKKTGNSDNDIKHFIQVFTDNKILTQDNNGDFFPAKSSELLKMSDIVNIIQPVSYVPVKDCRYHKLNEWFSSIYGSISKARGDIIGETTLKDLIRLENSEGPN